MFVTIIVMRRFTFKGSRYNTISGVHKDGFNTARFAQALGNLLTTSC